MTTTMDLLKNPTAPSTNNKINWLNKIGRKRPKLDSPYKTEADAATFLSFSVSKLRRLRKSGAISFILSGRSIRYTVNQLEKYMKSVSKQTCVFPVLKSKAITSQNVTKVHSTLLHGTTPEAVKLAAVHLAQQTFK